MEKFILTKDAEQILREQVIDNTRPGSVLRDFASVLDYLGTEGVAAAGKYNLLPIGAIGELDRRLGRPLQLQLRRPQLRSHPYLQGLHLLLRAAGLGTVDGIGSKARLVVQLTVLEDWRRLNPTEQYFTLLEAWLRVGQPEMVGEKRHNSESLLFPCVQTWQSVPARGVKFDLSRPQQAHLFGIWRDFYQLALMDLFGLMQVVHADRAPQPWFPAGVRHVPFGDAIFTLLAGTVPIFGEVWAEEEPDANEPGGAIRFGQWQRLFQPYFPDWRANLILPGPEAQAGTFVFRVTLGKIMRKIAILADHSLDDLVAWILRSVDFDNDHLYEITYRDRFGKSVRAMHPACDEGPWAQDVRIANLPLEPGQSMVLTYDFGDEWRFNVQLERIEPPGVRLKAPRILDSKGKAPEQYPAWEE